MGVIKLFHKMKCFRVESTNLSFQNLGATDDCVLRTVKNEKLEKLFNTLIHSVLRERHN